MGRLLTMKFNCYDPSMSVLKSSLSKSTSDIDFEKYFNRILFSSSSRRIKRYFRTVLVSRTPGSHVRDSMMCM